ncbi:MAG: hypothetical protein J0H48_03345 [Nitrosospira multiformis]|nr:hypothetical protein [Nitrosospira multiformis]
MIRQRKVAANRPGFAVPLRYRRFPGTVPGIGEPPTPPLMKPVDPIQ